MFSGKSAGPERVTLHVLKACATQLVWDLCGTPESYVLDCLLGRPKYVHLQYCQGDQQHRGPARYHPLTLSSSPSAPQTSAPTQRPPSSEVFWCLCGGWMHPWGWWSQVPSCGWLLCHVVPAESSAAQCEKDQRKAGADHSCLRARGTNRNMHNIKFTYVIDLELGALKNLSVYLWL